MELKSSLIKLIQDQHWPQAVIIDGENLEDITALKTDLIRVLVCPNHSYPQDECNRCQRYERGFLTDIIELKAGFITLKKEELRSAIQQFSYSSLELETPKILILEAAENLSRVSANSLLKFLEEPPHSTFIFLLSTNYNKVISTIRSRCVRFHLNQPSSPSISSQLEKIITAPNSETYLDFSYQWSKLPKETMVADLEHAYKNFLKAVYPQLAMATLILIDELKNWSFDRLAIARYLLAIDALRNGYEDL